MESAPPGELGDLGLGRSIIRWQSRTPPASWTWSAIAETISGPIVIGGTNIAVHDVDVDDPRTGVEHLGDLGAELREVGGEDRRGDPASGRQPGAHQTALSIEVPHSWQRRSWSWLIRTIVWWVPQPGHWETSS